MESAMKVYHAIFNENFYGLGKRVAVHIAHKQHIFLADMRIFAIVVV